MKLPNAEHAIVDIVKLERDILSLTHPRGRHKARVFLSALDLTAADSEELRTALLESAQSGDAMIGVTDAFGTRYSIDFGITRAGKSARVRGSWILRSGDGVPRLTSCYVL